VDAGLEAIAAVGELKSSVPLQTRVGIATGVVVVGDLLGSGEAQERGIIGETPNLAARLQGIAEPNAVVIAESTRRLLGDLFELDDLGTQALKGIAGPVPVWAALRPSWNCYFGAGPEQGPAKAKLCCSRVKPASENRGSQRR